MEMIDKEKMKEGLVAAGVSAKTAVEILSSPAFDRDPDELERLREKCNTQTMILRRLMPDKFPNTYFIHGELGEKDQNGMPEKIMVVPAYGVDFSYIYTREEKTVGPEW
jgi:hypothetical protein